MIWGLQSNEESPYLCAPKRCFAMKKWFFSCFFLLMFVFSAAAQSSDPFEEMERAFQKMIDQMRAGMAFGPGQDTTIYFKWDTLRNDGNGSFFFRLNPQTLGMRPGAEFDFYEEMDSLSRQLDRAMFGQKHPLPADDGANPNTEDGLLPEERLRLEDEKTPKATVPKKGPTVDPKTSKIKTTRI